MKPNSTTQGHDDCNNVIIVIVSQPYPITDLHHRITSCAGALVVSIPHLCQNGEAEVERVVEALLWEVPSASVSRGADHQCRLTPYTHS